MYIVSKKKKNNNHFDNKIVVQYMIIKWID